MNSSQTLATTEATDATITENQATDRSYNQKEVDDMMARMKTSLQKKLLKPYEDLGDPEELRAIRQEHEKRQTEQQLKRGEFEKTLQELAAKKDLEIQKRDIVIKEYKVNTPLMSAAARYRAVNADQVKALLSQNVRLGNEGEVEVTDHTGKVRYNDRGEPLQVDDLVREFLDSNPHFVSATPATTHSRTNVTNNNSQDIDVSKLDMRLAEHRKIYANMKQQKKF
jgi:hypothetical protein